MKKSHGSYSLGLSEKRSADWERVGKTLEEFLSAISLLVLLPVQLLGFERGPLGALGSEGDRKKDQWDIKRPNKNGKEAAGSIQDP